MVAFKSSDRLTIDQVIEHEWIKNTDITKPIIVHDDDSNDCTYIAETVSAMATITTKSFEVVSDTSAKKNISVQSSTDSVTSGMGNSNSSIENLPSEKYHEAKQSTDINNSAVENNNNKSIVELSEHFTELKTRALSEMLADDVKCINEQNEFFEIVNHNLSEEFNNSGEETAIVKRDIIPQKQTNGYNSQLSNCDEGKNHSKNSSLFSKSVLSLNFENKDFEIMDIFRKHYTEDDEETIFSFFNDKEENFVNNIIRAKPPKGIEDEKMLLLSMKMDTDKITINIKNDINEKKSETMEQTKKKSGRILKKCHENEKVQTTIKRPRRRPLAENLQPDNADSILNDNTQKEILSKKGPIIKNALLEVNKINKVLPNNVKRVNDLAESKTAEILNELQSSTNNGINDITEDLTSIEVMLNDVQNNSQSAIVSYSSLEKHLLTKIKQQNQLESSKLKKVIKRAAKTKPKYRKTENILTRKSQRLSKLKHDEELFTLRCPPRIYNSKRIPRAERLSYHSNKNIYSFEPVEMVFHNRKLLESINKSIKQLESDKSNERSYVDFSYLNEKIGADKEMIVS